MEWVVSLNNDANNNRTDNHDNNNRNDKDDNSNNETNISIPAQEGQESAAAATTSASTSVNRGILDVGDFPTGVTDLQHFSDLQKHMKRIWVLAYGKAWQSTRGSQPPQIVPPALQAMADAIQEMTASLERSGSGDVGESQRLVDDMSSLAMQIICSYHYDLEDAGLHL